MVLAGTKIIVYGLGVNSSTPLESIKESPIATTIARPIRNKPSLDIIRYAIQSEL